MNHNIKELVRKSRGHISTHNLASNPVQYRESMELWDDRIENFYNLTIDLCAKFLIDELDDHFAAEQLIEKLRTKHEN
jgi:hypothetical protein